jgi:ribosomal protein S18 acetylase RimI-like enzyme
VPDRATIDAMIRIENADTPELLPHVRELFAEYSESTGVDLCFQGFAQELAHLPGDYARPAGRLLLAYKDGRLLGCGALRPIQNRVCEMKRLYVRAAFRGGGAGGALIQSLIRSAKEIGYQKLRLDTLPSMVTAIAIYRSHGFKEIPPYRQNPVAGALFFEFDLK